MFVLCALPILPFQQSHRVNISQTKAEKVFILRKVPGSVLIFNWTKRGLEAVFFWHQHQQASGLPAQDRDENREDFVLLPKQTGVGGVPGAE